MLSCDICFALVDGRISKRKEEISSYLVYNIHWSLYKADTIRSKKMCPLYGNVRFIECFPKTQLFSKI